MDWFIQRHFEIISTLSGLIYLYFSVKQKIWLWPLGIITSVYSVLVFYQEQLYADMTLNIYYIVVSIYGWFHWLTRKENATHNSIKIIILSVKDWLLYLLLVLIFTLIFAKILIVLPQKIGLKPSSLPWWDAFLFSGSILATWMLARKILDQWLWWIVIDSISIGVFIYKELYFYSGLFLVYTFMAFVGYQMWKKEIKIQ